MVSSILTSSILEWKVSYKIPMFAGFPISSRSSYADIVDNFDGVMSVTYSPAMIQSAIQDMVDYLNGETVEQDHVIACEIVNSDNVKDYPSF